MVLGRNTALPVEAVLPHPRERADVESVEIEEYVADLHKKKLTGMQSSRICPETFPKKSL